jgi:hypothetical protein
MLKIPKKIGGYVGVFSLVLALLAYLPSIAPFTPALIGSVIAFFGAILGALSGRRRVALLTFYIVIATFLVSPISLWIEQYIELSRLVIGLIILGFIIALGLYINYRKSV